MYKKCQKFYVHFTAFSEILELYYSQVLLDQLMHIILYRFKILGTCL